MQDKSSNEKPKAPAASQVDVQAIRELVGLMGEHDLLELEYETDDLAIRLSKRPPAGAAMTQSVPQLPAAAVPAAVGAAPAADSDRYTPITSPMVGTFYPASGPDTGPFVSIGDEVSEDSVVCLIEAMKVFNEIKAGVRGRIAKLCASNEDTVEFGQTLFLVEPS